MKISIRHIVKVAEFLKGENTKIFEQKFSGNPPEKIKSLADSFYRLFGEWEDHNRYRALVEEIGTIEAGEEFVKKCEEAVARMERDLISSGVGGHIGKAGPQRAGRTVAENLALQYLWKYVDELKSGNAEFFSRLDRMMTSPDTAGEQAGGDLFAKIRGVLRKEKEGKSSIPELAGKEIKSLSKEEVAWIEARIADSKSGGEAHSADDLISVLKTFKPIGASLGRSINDFRSYSELSGWLDEVSFGNKEAYIASIEEAAQSNGMSEVIYDDDRWKVVLIGSTIAGQWWGRDTNFCISYLENNLYSKYSKEDNFDPYFIIDKWADLSNPMRKFTVAIEYDDEGSFKLSENEHTITDATNKKISLEDIRNYLGSDYDKILGAITLKARKKKQSAGKDNEEKILDIIESGDIPKIKKYEKEIVADNNLTEAFAKKLSEIGDTSSLHGLIKQVAPKLAEKNPLYFLENYHDKDWAKNYLETALKNIIGKPYEADKNIKYFLQRNSGKDWAKTYIENIAREHPFTFLTGYYNHEWAKPFLGISAERAARENGPYFLKELYERVWLKPYLEPYLEVAAENMAKKEPIAFINRYSNEPWGKDYKNIALEEIQKIAAEKPVEFMENYREAVWAKPYLAVLNEKIKEIARSNPANFLRYYKTNPNGRWIGTSLLEIAAESMSEKEPDSFLSLYSREIWAKPYIGAAAAIVTIKNPASVFFYHYRDSWALSKVDALDGKTPLEYARERLDEKRNVSKASAQIQEKLSKLARALGGLGMNDEVLELKRL